MRINFKSAKIKLKNMSSHKKVASSGTLLLHPVPGTDGVGCPQHGPYWPHDGSLHLSYEAAGHRE